MDLGKAHHPILNVSDDPLLQRFFLVSAAIFTVFGLISLVAHGLIASPPRLYRSGTSIALTVSGGTALALLYAQRPIAAFQTLLWGGWLVTSAVVLVTGGVRSNYVTVYPLIIIFAGWAIRASYGMLFGGVSVAFLGAATVADLMDKLPATQTEPLIVPAMVGLVIPLLSMIATHFYTQAYRNRFDAALERDMQLRTLFDAIPDLIWLKDTNGIYLACNHAYERRLGVRSNEIIGHGDLDFVPEKDAAHYRRRDLETLAADAPIVFEQRATYLADGEEALFSVIKTPIRTPDGKVYGILGIGRDITKRQQTEQALQESSQLLRTVIDENPSIVCLLGADGRIIIGNRALARFLHVTTEELPGHVPADFGAPYRLTGLESLAEVIGSGVQRYVRDRVLDPANGETRHYQSVCRPIRGPDGEWRVLVIATDISDLVRAQSQIEESERRLSYVLDATGDGVWDWDVSTSRATNNRRWLEILGFSSEDPTHSVDTFESMIHPDDHADVMAKLHACLRGEAPYVSTHRMFRPDGTLIWVLDRGNVVERAPDGKPLRMVGSVLDVTEQQRTETEFALYRSHLEKQIADLKAELGLARKAG